MASRKCRPHVELELTPCPRLHIRGRGRDRLGLILELGRKVEMISSTLYFSQLDFDLRGKGGHQVFSLHAVITGEEPLLQRVVSQALTGVLLDDPGEHTRKLIRQARPTLHMPVSKRFQVHVVITTPDEPHIVREVAMVAVRHRGPFHRFHAETHNSGRYPGTADFFIDALVGFPTREDADQAVEEFRRLPYDEIKVTRLYDEPDHRAGVKLSAAA